MEGAPTTAEMADLAERARAAEDREAYQELSRGASHRVGVVASVFPSNCVYYAVEGTFRLFPEDAIVVPTHLDRAATVTRTLQERGYDLVHLDGGWISCERMVRPEEAAEEASFLLDLAAGEGVGSPVSSAGRGSFFTKELFQRAAAWLHADPEWHALGHGFSTRVLLTCADRGTSILIEVVDGQVTACDATRETPADFRFEADSAAWMEILRGEADYYPLVRARRMKFGGSVLRLRLKMAPLDRMTYAAQRIFSQP